VTFTPLLAEPLFVQVHAFAALAAFVVGLVQIGARKGMVAHRVGGYLWIALMMLVALSSFSIHGLRQWGQFSLIHLLSISVLVLTPLALLAARRKHITTHGAAMVALFVGALVVAGAFTLLPGRVMHDVVFSNSNQR
jgi:uncharacterized membrane protein